MRHWRWAVVIGGVAALVSIPVVVGQSAGCRARHQPSTSCSDASLDSADDSRSAGLFESRGGLRLPDLGRYEDEIAPFKSTSRVRVWYARARSVARRRVADRRRARHLSRAGGLWHWDSGTRRIVFSPRDAVEPLRIPRLMDLSPAELGRRLLADADGETITSDLGPARRRPCRRRSAHHTRRRPRRRSTPSTCGPTRDRRRAARRDRHRWHGRRLRDRVHRHGLRSPIGGVMQFDPDEADEPVRQSAHRRRRRGARRELVHPAARPAGRPAAAWRGHRRAGHLRIGAVGGDAWPSRHEDRSAGRVAASTPCPRPTGRGAGAAILLETLAVQRARSSSIGVRSTSSWPARSPLPSSTASPAKWSPREACCEQRRADAATDQAVPRRSGGGRRDRPRRARGRPVRLPRAERRRQDDHDPHAAGADASHVGHDRGAGSRRPASPATGAAGRRHAGRGARPSTRSCRAPAT